MAEKSRVFIVGAGCFGTAMANCLAQNVNNSVVVYARELEVVESINSESVNTLFFPNRRINESIMAVENFDLASGCEFIFLSVPSGVVESVVAELQGKLSCNSIVINLAKGLARDGRTLVESLENKLVNNIVSLKGPTFAVELLSGNTSALTLATRDESVSSKVSGLFENTCILLDHTRDVKGCELLGVFKNIYAIALGVVAAQCTSPNINFLAFSNAVKEMRTALTAMGCREETLFNFCGFGDLALTSLSDLSRNRTLGMLIGKGFWDNRMRSSVVIEGYRSLKEVRRQLARVLKSDFRARCPLIYHMEPLIAGDITPVQYMEHVKSVQ